MNARDRLICQDDPAWNVVVDEILAQHRDEILAGNADAAAERDCLAMAVQFALQWKEGAPVGLREGIEEILATMPSPVKESAPTEAATFFRPGRTYQHGVWRFRCLLIVTHPVGGHVRAWGWFGREAGSWRQAAFSPRQYETRDWVDVTEGAQP